MTTIKKIAAKLFLTVTMLMGTATAEAQQLQASLSHYSTDDGLSSSAISYIAQDNYGYIWLATWNGLSRFDGYNFYNYKTGNGSHIPLLHNRIMDLAIDNQQNIWMRMYDGRIFVMKRAIDRIVNPFEGISGSDEFRTSYPIVVTSSGDVLVSINDIGLYKLRMEQRGVKAQLVTTGGLTITSMAEGYQSDIWLGTNEGVHRMDLSNQTIERKGRFLDEYVTCLYSNGYNIFAGTKSGKILSFSYGQEPNVIRHGGFAINRLFVDSHGIVWFSDEKMGALRIDPATGEEHRYAQHVPVPDHDGFGGTFNETNGTVWMRMNHGGYGYYNRKTDSVEYFHNDPSNPWNLSNSVNASLELNEGVIWESTNRRGLEKLEIQKNTFVRTLLMPESNTPSDNEVRAMLYDEQRGLLIMGNKNHCLFLMKGDSTRQVITKDDQGHELGRIYGISKDSQGNYWLSSKDNGIYKMSAKAGGGWTLQNYCHDDGDIGSISSNGAYATVEDKSGNIWVATYGGGVNVLTTDKKGRKVFLHHKNRMKSYPYNSFLKVRTIDIGPDGRVWAGTTDGVLILSMNDKGEVQLQRLENSKKEPNQILMSNDIVCISRDRHNSMWLGTNGGGLSHTIGQDSDGRWLFENFGAKDGLPSEEIRSITFDSRNNVWFATDHIICSFDVAKRIFTTFSNLDGVDETICSEGAAISLPNNNILIGTVNGYYVIDRKKLVNTAGNLLKLRITDFFIDDEVQSPRFSGNYDYYVPESRQVELPSHNTRFGFRFVSLNYQLQHRVHYQYLLQGYDHDWKNAPKDRQVHYSSLPTGTYQFKVKAFLLDSPDKYDERVIEVTVPPYFLFSADAIWLYMAVTAALALWLMFWRQRSIAHSEKLRQLRSQDDRNLNVRNEADYQFVQKIIRWIENYYTDPGVTSDVMAAETDMEPHEFERRTKQLTGQTFRDLLTDQRVRKAIELLETTSKSMADIAFETGFTDASTFARKFKEKLGKSPSKYRDDMKKSPAANTTDDYELMDDV